MDTEMDSPAHDIGDSRTAFRKPSNDSANRKYRRRSQVNDGSTSSDGSPEWYRNSSPNHSRGDVRKVSEPNNARKDDRRESDRDYGRTRHGRGDDSYRHDRYSKHEDNKHEKDADENSRKYRSSPSRSSRDSRGGHHSDRRRVEPEHSRSRSDSDRHSRDKYSSSGHRSKDLEKGEEQSSNRAGSGRKHADSRSSEKEKDYAGSRDRLNEKRDYLRSSSDRQFRDDKRKYEDSDMNKEKDTRFKSPRDRFEDKSGFASEKLDTQSKKLKGFCSEKFADGKSDAEEKLLPSSKPAIVVCEKKSTGQSSSKEPGLSGDIDAAKVAAMKAAEMVNKNLVGTGYLTTDQKKKLLWGNKKSEAAEETAHRWDSALIGDRERQEKFNKLMSLRLPWYIWPIVGCEGQHKNRGGPERARSPCREAEGNADGSGEAVHSWTSPKRWTYCRIRSLILKPLSSCFLRNGFFAKPLITITLHSMRVTSNQPWFEKLSLPFISV
ncbi:PREDICTED: arginine/serine-rich coiled-coil protein 2 isoform X1 [Tarenaya hassleriana]|uniref:arginine/serine-rich coiled-coil protein 2 isoform X1 n=1 Tax=Tarenaya hassleriana TaxID=28532 RepID=UPI00053C485E|nr:PREDICTED: arginine/serine-rich coiled-coil protein 2 isoform X1 [Tarenaya hassleriana]